MLWLEGSMLLSSLIILAVNLSLHCFFVFCLWTCGDKSVLVWRRVLMKCKFVNLSGCIQMEPRCRLRGCRNGKSASLGWSSVCCLPQRLRCQSQNKEVLCKIKQNSRISVSVFQSVFVPSVGNVRALYMLPWILAVVVDIVRLMPFLVTLPT